MSQLMREFLDVTGINKPQYTVATPVHLFPYKRRVSLIGTVGAGKSTVVGGIVMAAETLVADNPNFYCRVLEGTSEIHQDVSDLRDGHFPKKTVPFGAFASEAGLLMEWERTVGMGKYKKVVGKRLLQLPICDIAGEDLAQMIRQVRAAGPLGEIARQAVRNLIAYVRESDGFIITIKATRAKGLMKDGKQLEAESDGKVSADPDVNLVRILEDLMNYKATHRSRPIQFAAIIVTAWDKLKQSGLADRIGFDILNPYLGQADLEHFVQGCFPAVYAAIKSLRIPNVTYFPSFFETELDEQGNEVHWQDGSPKIKHLEDTAGNPEEWWRNLRKIQYAERYYIQLIHMLHSIAV